MAYPIRSRRRRSSGGVNPVESRYFTELSPAAMQYYSFSSEVMLPGDFTVKFKISPRGASFLNIIGGSNVRWNLQASGVLNLLTDGATRTTSSAVSRGVLTDCTIVRTGATLSVTLGSNTTENFSVSTNDLFIDLVGLRNGATGGTPSYFEGVISDLHASAGAVTIVDIPFNTGLSDPTIPNLAAGNPGAPASATAINGPTAELYMLNTAATPNQWENGDKSKIIPVAS